MKKEVFSRDPKVNLITIEEFYEDTDYLAFLTKKDLWKSSTTPKKWNVYYKLTSKYLICISFGSTYTNYGTQVKEKLDYINVAIRDGKTEYQLIENKLVELKKEREIHKRSKKLQKRIEGIEAARKLLPKFKTIVSPTVKPFESYLIDTGYKTNYPDLQNKYIVFDVETNGLRQANDDLLSLSIYDPTTGFCYNRFLPLDLQPVILTGYINGISEKTLSQATHITQEEFDRIFDFFHLNDRILLSFSGGKGTFDQSFLQHYFQRQNIKWVDSLKFRNIKDCIPKAPFGSEGQLTKDNLCKLFGIEGIQKKHSSYNDCILEWKLFEKLKSECVFFIDEHLYKYTPEYIIPVTYLSAHPELATYAGIVIPSIEGKATELFRVPFPPKLLSEIKKFPTNITGITIEHGINSYLHAIRQDNHLFLMTNRSKLKYIGSLDSKIEKVPIISEEDGTVKALKKEDEKYIQEVNSVTQKIINQIKPMADYLLDNIFTQGGILTQELSVSDDKKVLALCDLSDKDNVLEIKTTRVLNDNELIKPEIARQLYYQSKGRNTFILSVKFDTHLDKKKYEIIVDDLNVILYKILLSEFDPKTKIHEYTLDSFQIELLREIIYNPSIPKTELSKKVNTPIRSLERPLWILQVLGYLKKETNNNSSKSHWIVIRGVEDTTTRFIIDDNTIKRIDD